MPIRTAVYEDYSCCGSRYFRIKPERRHSAWVRTIRRIVSEALFAEVTVGVDPDPANNEKITAWCKDSWEALHPYSAGGGYVNFMMDEGQDRVRAT